MADAGRAVLLCSLALCKLQTVHRPSGRFTPISAPVCRRKTHHPHAHTSSVQLFRRAESASGRRHPCHEPGWQQQLPADSTSGGQPTYRAAASQQPEGPATSGGAGPRASTSLAAGRSSLVVSQQREGTAALQRFAAAGGSRRGSVLLGPHQQLLATAPARMPAVAAAAARVSLIVEGVGAFESSGNWPSSASAAAPADAAAAEDSDDACVPSAAALAALGVAAAGEIAAAPQARSSMAVVQASAARFEEAALAARDRWVGGGKIDDSRRSFRARPGPEPEGTSGPRSIAAGSSNSSHPPAEVRLSGPGSGSGGGAVQQHQQQRPQSGNAAGSSAAAQHHHQQHYQQQQPYSSRGAPTNSDTSSTTAAAATASGIVGTSAFKGPSRDQAAPAGWLCNCAASPDSSPGGPGCYKAISYHQLDPARRGAVAMRPASPPSEQLRRRQLLQQAAAAAATAAATTRRRVSCTRRSAAADGFGSGGGSTARGGAAAGSLGVEGGLLGATQQRATFDSPRLARPEERLAAAAARLGVPAPQRVGGRAAGAAPGRPASSPVRAMSSKQQQHQSFTGSGGHGGGADPILCHPSSGEGFSRERAASSAAIPAAATASCQRPSSTGGGAALSFAKQLPRPPLCISGSTLPPHLGPGAYSPHRSSTSARGASRPRGGSVLLQHSSSGCSRGGGGWGVSSSGKRQQGMQQQADEAAGGSCQAPDLSALPLADNWDSWGFAVGSIGGKAAAGPASGGGAHTAMGSSRRAGTAPATAPHHTAGGRQALRTAGSSRPCSSKRHQQHHHQQPGRRFLSPDEEEPAGDLGTAPELAAIAGGDEAGCEVSDFDWDTVAGLKGSGDAAADHHRPTSAAALSFAREQWADNLLRQDDQRVLAGEEAVADAVVKAAAAAVAVSATAQQQRQRPPSAMRPPKPPHQRCSTAPAGGSSRVATDASWRLHQQGRGALLPPSLTAAEAAVDVLAPPDVEPPALSQQPGPRHHRQQRPASAAAKATGGATGGAGAFSRTTRAEAARGLRAMAASGVIPPAAVAVRTSEAELLYDPDLSVLAHVRRAPATRLPPNLAALSRKWARAAARAVLEAAL